MSLPAHRLKAIVTGGAGFVGSHLCDRLLADGLEVVALDDFSTGTEENLAHLRDEPRFRLERHDVREPYRHQADRIYNLACPASPVHYQADPIKTTLTSVLGVVHGLELAAATGARFLQASTSEVYGDPEVHPQREDYRGSVNPIGPRACYDESKRCAESLCLDFARERGVDVRLARIFNTYGPRMALDDGRVVSNFIVQALRGEPLTVYGDGSQTRSFCYVTDLVDGLVRLMEGDGADAINLGPVNLGNPDEHTIEELARAVCAAIGCSAPIEHVALPIDDPRRRKPDITRAQSHLGYAPTVNLGDGMDRTIESFRARVGGPIGG